MKENNVDADGEKEKKRKKGTRKKISGKAKKVPFFFNVYDYFSYFYFA